ncbi:MAG: nicotinate (nicotinamide) nucleotide adenylyltransferase [Proteobacteria bacterium]|nr:nicotinate (nicotinamide) nucleotide adenylyltransferase [Pseudomonadota bacterium]
MHLAIFGGTFNPVHFGHLRGAEEVIEKSSADRVLFIPVARPPHKDDVELSSPEHRLEMLRLAIEGNPAFAISELEIKRGGISYTIDTLSEILDSYSDKPDLSLVIGTDSFNELSSWHRYVDILRLANLIVIRRPGEEREKIEDVLPVELAGSFCYDSKVDVFLNSEGRSIKFLDSVQMDISSSMIREFISRGESVRHLTSDKVVDYIEKNKLYRD